MCKKLQLILLSLLLTVPAVAKPVDKGTAARAASNLLQKPVVDITPAAFTECYLFAATDGVGFVLLSADNSVRPLLAYSRESSFPTDDMPEHLVAWIDGYQREIASVKTYGGMVDKRIDDEWSRLLDKGGFKGDPVVGPLLETEWKQSKPYNDRCPFDSTRNERTLTGCVATATAQVMCYWRHPVNGRGSHAYSSDRYGTIAVNYDTSVYDWDNMLPVVRPWSSQVEIDAVAKLCFEVGVAMDMSYGTGASGAYEHSGGMLQRFSAELALENHFGYNPAMYTDFKEGHTDEEWIAIIGAELDSLRPVIYTGSSSSGGHAFVIDGYDRDGFFHINWGWGTGFFGYYNLSHLAYGQEGNSNYSPFNEMNNAILGVYPVTRNDSVSVVTVVSSDPSRGTVRGSGTYAVDRDRVLLLATPNDGYRFDHWASGNTANPIFYFPTVDYSDTAYFVPLTTDTLGYSHNFVPNFDTVYEMAHTEWGIRIPASRIPAGRRLEKVMNFIYTTGSYVLKIYQDENPGIPVYEDTLALQSYGWRTIELDSPLALDATKPLWITFVTEGVNYPAGICPNTGVPDGSWIKHDGVWELVDTNVTGYYTWSIFGILDNNNAIDEPVADGVKCLVDGLTLKVDNPDGRQLSLFDIQGRLLCSFPQSNHLSFNLPAAGIYLLQADGLPARRVIAVN